MITRELRQRTAALLAAGIFLVTVSPIALADSYSSYSSTTTSSSSSSHQALLPAGTSLVIRSNGAVPTNVGDSFTGSLRSPVVLNGATILPAGSTVKGEVTAVNASNGISIQMRDISTPSGVDVPIQSSVTFTAVQSNATVVTDSNGNQMVQGGLYSYVPSPQFGPRRSTVVGRLATSTVGGAVFGGVTGTISGIIIPAVYNTNYHEGTGALRGLAWGSAVGAGLGLVTGGLYEAVSAHKSNGSVTSVSNNYSAPQSPQKEYTNISTGSLEEQPVSTTTSANGSMPSTSVLNGSSDFTITLDQPAKVSY